MDSGKVDMAKWLLKISPGDICNQMSVDGNGWPWDFWRRIVYKNKEYNKGLAGCF